MSATTHQPSTPDSTILAEADRLCVAGDVEAALRLLRIAAADTESSAEVWYRLGQLLAELGRAEEAWSSLEGALVREAGHLRALSQLAELTCTEGQEAALKTHCEDARAAGVSERDIRALLPRSAPAFDTDSFDSEAGPAEAGIELVPADADLIRFMALFSGREDIHARQWWAPARSAGGYAPVHEPLTPASLRRHFLGDDTLGIYVVRVDDTCMFCALDLDIPPSVIDAGRADPGLARRASTAMREACVFLRRRLRELGMDPIVEDSGYKGRHLWIPFDQPVLLKPLHEFGQRFLAQAREGFDTSLVDVEFFPKQAVLRGKGLGNLIKLPLGIHRRSGRRGTLLDEDLKPIHTPFTWLRGFVRTPGATVMAALHHLRTLPAAATAPDPEHGPGESSAPEVLLPAPPAPPPDWTEADFEANLAVSHLLHSCPLLRAIVQGILEHRVMTRDARLALQHTLGHLPAGLLACNWLVELTQGSTPDKLVSVLRGSPISCQKLRARFPEKVRDLTCACEFPWAPEQYPHPLLHLERPDLDLGMVAQNGGNALSIDLETEVRRFTTLVRRVDEMVRERGCLGRFVAQALRAMPDRALGLPEGVLRLTEEGGIEILAWEPMVLADPTPVPDASPIPLKAPPAFRIVAAGSHEEASMPEDKTA